MSLPGPIFHSSKTTQITAKPQDVPRGFRVVVVRLGRGHRAGGWGSGGRGLPPAAVTNNRAPPLPEPLRPLGEPAVKRSLQKQGLCFTLNLYIRDSWSRQQHWDTAAAPAAHGTSANELPVPNWCRSWGCHVLAVPRGCQEGSSITAPLLWGCPRCPAPASGGGISSRKGPEPQEQSCPLVMQMSLVVLGTRGRETWGLRDPIEMLHCF